MTFNELKIGDVFQFVRYTDRPAIFISERGELRFKKTGTVVCCLHPKGENRYRVEETAPVLQES